MRSFAIRVILILFVLHSEAHAQWEIVAPELCGPPVSFYGVFGSMEYKDGIVWAGGISIFKSLDTGKTWQSASPTLGEVRSLRFFSRDIGAACIGAGGVHLTTNQGASWRQILDIGYSNAVIFGDTPNDIMVTMHDACGVMITRDRGRTWKNVTLQTNGFTTDGVRDNTGRISIIVGHTQFISTLASIFVTTDFGETWTQTSGTFDHDTWSIAIDSCDPDRIYAANEEVLSLTNGISEVFMTSDAGASWSSVFKEINLLSGAIATGPNTVYATSQKSGLIRSTDRGLTWKKIGGPGTTFDSRGIAVVNDNIVFALDTAGSIWRTVNSGGDPVSLPNPGSLTMSMPRPFDDEQPYVCDLPIGRGIVLSPTCNAKIKTVRILGDDPDAFHVLDHPTEPQTGDSIWLSFNVDEAGEYFASVEVEMENGEKLTIPLHAIAKPPVTARLAEINDMRNDTIGGTIILPIRFTSDGPTPSGELSIFFDTSVLVYKGTTSLAGDHLDLPGSPMAQVANIRFPSLPQGDTIGFAFFEYYPLRDSCTTIRIDSLRFDNDPELCLALSDDAVETNICTSIACGTMLLSRYTRYGIMPQLSLSPNPASTSITIRSQQDVGDVSIEIFDAAGILKHQASGILMKNSAVELQLQDIPSGVYYARVATLHAVRTLRFIRQ